MFPDFYCSKRYSIYLVYSSLIADSSIADFFPEILILEWCIEAFNPRLRSRYQVCLTLGYFLQSRIVWLDTRVFSLTFVLLIVGSFRFCKTQGITQHVSLVDFRSTKLVVSAICNFCLGQLSEVLSLGHFLTVHNVMTASCAVESQTIKNRTRQG